MDQFDKCSAKKDGKSYWCMGCRQEYNNGRYDPILAAARRLLNQKRIKARRRALSARKRGKIPPELSRCAVRNCPTPHEPLIMHHLQGYSQKDALNIVDVCKKCDYKFHRGILNIFNIDLEFIKKENKEFYEKTNTN